MNIEQWPAERLVPYARNARKISDAAVDKVAASLKEFGWRQPIVVDTEGVIIAGHTRLLAAKKLGLKTVPVHVATELTPGQVKAYRLMDNRSHEEATWDFDLLGPEMLDLQAMGLDLSLTGFNENELAAFIGGQERWSHRRRRSARGTCRTRYTGRRPMDSREASPPVWGQYGRSQRGAPVARREAFLDGDGPAIRCGIRLYLAG